MSSFVKSDYEKGEIKSKGVDIFILTSITDRVLQWHFILIDAFLGHGCVTET